jgi:hypothetical protein
LAELAAVLSSISTELSPTGSTAAGCRRSVYVGDAAADMPARPE